VGIGLIDLMMESDDPLINEGPTYEAHYLSLRLPRVLGEHGKMITKAGKSVARNCPCSVADQRYQDWEGEQKSQYYNKRSSIFISSLNKRLKLFYDIDHRCYLDLSHFPPLTSSWTGKGEHKIGVLGTIPKRQAKNSSSST